jgi:hypothetical protein
MNLVRIDSHKPEAMKNPPPQVKIIMPKLRSDDSVDAAAAEEEQEPEIEEIYVEKSEDPQDDNGNSLATNATLFDEKDRNSSDHSILGVNEYEDQEAEEPIVEDPYLIIITCIWHLEEGQICPYSGFHAKG